MIKKFIYGLGIKKLLLVILLIAFCVPNLSAGTLFSFNIRPYRIVTLLLFISLFLKKEISFIPSKKIFIFFIYMLLLSLVTSFFFGYDRLIFDYIFAYIIVLVVYNYGKDIKYLEWLELFQYAALFLITLSLTSIVLQKDILIDFINNPIHQHPAYISIFPGGLNLDATWIALFSLFFINKPIRGYIYLLFSIIISMILSSRVGLIIDIMALSVIFINHLMNIEKNKRKIIVIVFTILFAIAGYLLYYFNIAGNILSRFTEIGTDGGSQGRLNIWKNIIPNFLKNPFGYGVGNGMQIIKDNTKMWFGEDNVHNIYFQMLLDTGFIGLGYFIYLIISFIKKNRKILLKVAFVVFFVFYFIIGFIQFKGAEIFVYYVLGVYLIISKQGEIYEKKD